MEQLATFDDGEHVSMNAKSRVIDWHASNH